MEVEKIRTSPDISHKDLRMLFYEQELDPDPDRRDRT